VSSDRTSPSSLNPFDDDDEDLTPPVSSPSDHSAAPRNETSELSVYKETALHRAIGNGHQEDVAVILSGHKGDN